MVRTRPLESSKGFKTTLVKTEFAKTTRPEDLPVTASVLGESNEVLGSSFVSTHLVINYSCNTAP